MHLEERRHLGHGSAGGQGGGLVRGLSQPASRPVRLLDRTSRDLNIVWHSALDSLDVGR